MGKMIKYHDNGGDVIRKIEVDLINVAEPMEYLEDIAKKYQNIFNFNKDRNRFIYKTEVLIPKIDKDRLNLLIVLGNPAIHSVAEGMFFSYEGVEGRRREHRFWRALRECEILKFKENMGKPTPENNEHKRSLLLNGEYKGDFNIFLLPYFSFPTPSSGACSGVNGIRKIIGKQIFEEMKEFEFQRFRDIILYNNIENALCFQKTDVLREIKKRTNCEQVNSILNNPDYPVYEIAIASKHIILYYAGPTRLLHTNKSKEILKNIVADIKVKTQIG